DACEQLRSPLSVEEERQMAGKRKPVIPDLKALPLVGQGSLVELLLTITDPRKRRGRRHGLQAVLGVAVLATLCGMRSFEAIAEWVAALPMPVLRKFGCRKAKAPSESTIRRVLQSINPVELDTKLGQWISTLEGDQLEAIAFDGKTLRGSGHGEAAACHLLSAVVHGSGTVVAQQRVSDKTNEITQARAVLEPIPLEGRIVTADAMHTQTDLARYLVEERGAHYIFIAKDNQPTLHEDLASFDWESFPPSGRNLGEGPRPDRPPPTVDHR
ncbi:MAG: ISAs1 family transposase, partial [Thermodesulfobacteriota bacterium]